MKKIISVLLSFIILITLIGLIFILNINNLLKFKTIDKVSSKIDYLNLVNINTEENELKDTYDSIYLFLQEEGLSSELITKIYQQDFFRKVTSKIIYIEVNYLLTGNIIKTYTGDELNNLFEEDVNKIKNLTDSERKKLESVMRNTSEILTMENIIRSNINNIDTRRIELTRYILGDKFKVILLCLLIIAILLLFILNRERVFIYVFVPTIICSILLLCVSLFFTNVILQIISNKFVEVILYPFIKLFLDNLLFTSLIILGISIIYLIMNEIVVNKEKRKIRPKIKNKGIIGI